MSKKNVYVTHFKKIHFKFHTFIYSCINLILNEFAQIIYYRWQHCELTSPGQWVWAPALCPYSLLVLSRVHGFLPTCLLARSVCLDWRRLLGSVLRVPAEIQPPDATDSPGKWVYLFGASAPSIIMVSVPQSFDLHVPLYWLPCWNFVFKFYFFNCMNIYINMTYRVGVWRLTGFLVAWRNYEGYFMWTGHIDENILNILTISGVSTNITSYHWLVVNKKMLYCYTSSV